jgi:hypothetical protein
VLDRGRPPVRGPHALKAAPLLLPLDRVEAVKLPRPLFFERVAVHDVVGVVDVPVRPAGMFGRVAFGGELVGRVRVEGVFRGCRAGRVLLCVEFGDAFWASLVAGFVLCDDQVSEGEREGEGGKGMQGRGRGSLPSEEEGLDD